MSPSDAVHNVFYIPQLLPWFARSRDSSGQSGESHPTAGLPRLSGCSLQPGGGGFLPAGWLPGEIPPGIGPFSISRRQFSLLSFPRGGCPVTETFSVHVLLLVLFH